MHDFYGANDIAVTKTMTKESKMTNEMEEKLKGFDIIVEESQGNASVEQSYSYNQTSNSKLSVN